jgi:eukaryotic-like serine/threonine-protein kinase
MLTPGSRLGPYEILAPLGAGGMGEVYRGRDTRLGRTVAIKTSREQFSERFEREARAIASLNHPNICQVYDVGPNYLVMEFIEGQPLHGPVPAETALDYVRQIAAALDAAHERGIVHRDLKPANILLTPEGVVKVLDFGLAKMGGAAAATADDSPTFTLGVTQAGMIMGTAAYMAPEQARGKVVDKRADIWAFGVVLYELLTGAQVFPGDTVSDSLAAVLKEEPDWSSVPARFEPLLRRCLAKDPAKRLRDIGDAMALLELSAAAPSAPPAPARRAILPWAVAAALAIACAGVGIPHFRETPPAPPDPVRFRIPLPDRTSFSATGSLTLSPDGRHLAFSAVGPDGRAGVWVRDMDSFDVRRLPGADTGVQPPPFIWSPDSRFVAFSYGGSLKSMDLQGGSPVVICPLHTAPIGGAWNSDGVIIFGNNRGGLMRVPAAGGAATPLTTLDPARHERAHQLPSFLPDGRRFLYLRLSVDSGESGIFAGSFDDPPSAPAGRRILATGIGAQYIAGAEPSRGWLIFHRDGTVMAQPLDNRTLQLVGAPQPLAEGVGTVFDTGLFSASRNGALVYRGATDTVAQLTWFDSQGAPAGKIGAPGNFEFVQISPDARKAAVILGAPGKVAQNAIWILDLSTGDRTRLTFEPLHIRGAVWSPDSKRVAYAIEREDGPNSTSIFVKAADGSSDAELVLKSQFLAVPSSWSSDGRFLLFNTATKREQRMDIWVLPLDGDRRPFPFLATPGFDGDAQFSPDCRWVAYSSNETGIEEVYVRPFSPTPGDSSGAGPKWLVSTNGGVAPQWSADGKQLAFIDNNSGAMLVDVSANPVFHAGTPRRQRTYSERATAGDLTPDLKRTLLAVPAGNSAAPFFNVVLHWPSTLK